MKNILIILGIFLGVLLFTSQQEENSDSTIPVYESVMTEKDSAQDIEHQLVVMSNDLKSSNCLTPRRTAQSINYTLDLRVYKNTERLLRITRIKEAEQLLRVSAYVSYCKTTNFYALLSSMGYHIYALRKIII